LRHHAAESIAREIVRDPSRQMFNRSQNATSILDRSAKKMAKFLNTSATNYFLEELIKSASDRLILISPYLRINDRIKELLEDKNRLKLDVRVVYGKNELQPDEINWLRELAFVRTSYCRNLHAKCYLNEEQCIITSLNLYEFSQVNNNEMGVLISRSEDADLYKDAYEESQRIIRASEEIRMSLEKVSQDQLESTDKPTASKHSDGKLSTSKLGKKLGMKTAELESKLIGAGLLELRDGKQYITDAGKNAGGEFRMSKQFGPYFLWPENLFAT
jgi:phosphatidylserine/phosphatidylglycerophosphate/cardiolipin synthase-like enzyme